MLAFSRSLSTLSAAVEIILYSPVRSEANCWVDETTRLTFTLSCWVAKKPFCSATRYGSALENTPSLMVAGVADGARAAAAGEASEASLPRSRT